MSKRKSDRVKVTITWTQPRVGEMGRVSNASIHAKVDEAMKPMQNKYYLADSWIRDRRWVRDEVHHIELKFHVKGSRDQRKTEWVPLLYCMSLFQKIVEALDPSLKATIDIDFKANRMPWTFYNKLKNEQGENTFRIFIRPGTIGYSVKPDIGVVRVADSDRRAFARMFDLTEEFFTVITANEFYVIGEPRAARKVTRLLDSKEDDYVDLQSIRYIHSHGVLDDLVTVLYRNTEVSDQWDILPGFNSGLPHGPFVTAALTGELTLTKGQLKYNLVTINM